MSKAYIFDWGDTLMVDFPEKEGRMVDWDVVEEIPGATETLSYLSKKSNIYVGTGAEKATSDSIQGALRRVGLDKYVSGYFCPIEIGYAKPSKAFYSAICKSIGLAETEVTMVGDSLERDVIPALNVGMNAIWLNSENKPCPKTPIHQIQKLTELCS